MIIIKSAIVKLKMSEIDKQKILMLTGCKRTIWNLALSYKKELYETYKRRNPCVDNPIEKKEIFNLSKNSTIQKAFAHKEVANYPGYEFLSNLASQPMQQSLNDLDQAYTYFFKGITGYPKFKKKNDNNNSLRFLYSLYLTKTNKKHIKVRIGEKIWIGKNPSKNDNILFSPLCKIHNITLKISNTNEAFAIICYSYEQMTPINNSTMTLGIDVGITDSITTSNGQHYNIPNLEKIIEKRKRKQRSFKKKKTSSRSYNKIKKQVRKHYAKEANIRQDFHHKISDKLTKNQGYIIREELNIANMTKSASGTKDNPGKKVAQKTALNREIASQAWGQFFKYLDQKAENRGVHLIKILPYGTSQTCSQCGVLDALSRRGKKFNCTSCGFAIDADINAAINIRTLGQREIAGRGILSLEGPLTPELEIKP